MNNPPTAVGGILLFDTVRKRAVIQMCRLFVLQFLSNITWLELEIVAGERELQLALLILN